MQAVSPNCLTGQVSSGRGVFLCTLLGVALCATLSPRACADTPASQPATTSTSNPKLPDAATLTAIIQKLNAADFQTRETASTELAALPVEALPALQSALKNAKLSPEAEARSQTVIATLQIKIIQAKEGNHPVFIGADPEKIARTDTIITQVIPLQNFTAGQLRTDIAALITDPSMLHAVAENNSLVVTDTSAKIRRLVEIIQKVDAQPMTKLQTDFRQMLAMPAPNAASMIKSILRPQPGGGGPVSAQLYVDSDARTNTIILVGPAEDVQTANRLLDAIEGIKIINAPPQAPAERKPVEPGGAPGRGSVMIDPQRGAGVNGISSPPPGGAKP